MKNQNKINIRKLTYLAMLTALVVVLQLAIAPLIGAATGLSPALVLIPMILGVTTCGIGAGAWLGAVFSFIVMFDPTTVPFLEFNAPLTIILVFVKGIGSAVLAGLIFKLLRKKSTYLALIVSATAAPILNTGIFVLGCLAFFRELTGVGIYSLFITLNFAVELIINAVMVPVIYRLISHTKLIADK